MFEQKSLIIRIKAANEMLDVLNYSYGYTFILTFFIISIIGIFTKKIKDKKIKLLIIGSLLAVIINIYANSLHGIAHFHYYMTFIPILIIPAGLMFNYLYQRISNGNEDIFVGVAVCIAIAIFLSWNSIAIQNANIISTISNRYSDNAIYNVIGKYIEENSDKGDLVQLIGGGGESVTANFRTKRLSASKYSYLPLWDSFSDEVKIKISKEFILDIKNNKPKLLLLADEHKQKFDSLISDKDDWNKFLQQNYNLEQIELPYMVYKLK